MALLKNDHINIIPNLIGDHRTPILVSFDDNGQALVGRTARFAVNSSVLLSNLPDIAGKTFSEIEALPDFPFSYKLRNNYNKPYIIIDLKNRTMELTVEEVLSHVFRYVRLSSAQYLNAKVSRAVMTVPDDVSESQLLSIKAAANLGGLRITRSTTDSIATIYAYDINEDLTEEEKNVLVMQMDTDFTNLVLIGCYENTQEIIGKRHLPEFGAVNFYMVLEKHLLTIYNKITGIDLRNEVLKARLRQEVKYISHGLARSNSFEFFWDFIGVGINVSVEISRARYDEFTLGVISELLGNITEFLLEQEIKRSDIAYIILLGSSFELGKILKEIQAYFYGHELRYEKGVNEAPVIGIVKMENALSQFIQQLATIFPDTLHDDLGIEINGGIFDVIIERGSVVPIRKAKLYTITFKEQNKVKIVVLEGKRSISRKNVFLGEIIFNREPIGFRGQVLYRVDFDIKSHRKIQITATDLETNIGRSLQIEKDFNQLNNGGSMEPPENERYVEKDRQYKAFHDLKSEIESVAHELRAHIESRSGIIKKINSTIDLHLIKASVAEIIEWCDNHSYTEVESLKELKSKFEVNIKPILAHYYSC